MSTSFDEVYREHVTAVWRYVRTRVPADADADDLTADVFTAAMRSWDRFDETRGSVAGWLIGIARHKVADWWQRRSREVPVEAVEAVDRSETAADPETEMLRSLAADDVRRRLWVLTPREREAIAMRFGADLSSSEIGVALGISATGARMLVYRGVAKLREVMTP